jgi:hypothetical protein
MKPHMSLKAGGLALGLMLLTGCSAEPFRLDLAADHPANPRAPEAEFVAPADPFAEGASVLEEMSREGAAMRMDHGMGRVPKEPSETERGAGR